MAKHDDLGFTPSNTHDDLGFAPSKSENPDSNISYLESLLRGGAQGATLGFADELSGAGDALLDPEGNYSKHRDESRANFDAAQQSNPKTFLAGQLAGGIIPSFLTPAATTYKGLAAVGAGIGALTGAGTSTADLTQGDVGEFAKDVGSNAAVGGVLNASLGKLLSKLSPSALENTAAKATQAAIGKNKTATKELIDAVPRQKGGSRLLEDSKNLSTPNEFQETPTVTMGSSGEDRLMRIDEGIKNSGKANGDILHTFDNLGAENPDLKENFFNPKTVTDKIRELQQNFKINGQDPKIAEESNNILENAIEALELHGNDPINFSEAAKLKNLIKTQTSFGENSGTKDLMNQVYGIINAETERAADKVATLTNNPDLAQRFLRAKDMYRTFKDARDSVLGQYAKEVTGNTLGLTDYMSGVIGAAAHGGPTGIAAALGHKVAKSYGSGIVARTAYTGANIGKALTKVPTDLLKSSGESLIASGGQLEGKLGRVLIEASGRDDVGRNAVIFSLSQNPAYRQLLNSIVPSDDIK